MSMLGAKREACAGKLKWVVAESPQLFLCLLQVAGS